MKIKQIIREETPIFVCFLIIIFLLAIGSLEMSWHYQGQIERVNFKIMAILLGSYVIIPIIIGIGFGKMINVLCKKNKMNIICHIVYLSILMMTLSTLIINRNSDYRMFLNIGGVINLYIPAIYVLSMIPAIYLLCIIKEDCLKVCAFILAISFPVLLCIYCFCSGFDMSAELLVVMLALLIKLVYDKNPSSNQWKVLLLAVIMLMIGYYIWFLKFIDADYLTGTIFTAGEHTQKGQFFSKMLHAINQSKLIGMSDYYINDSGQTMQGYIYFVKESGIYFPVSILLRFGWIGELLLFLACMGLAGCFFYMSTKSSENHFARYILFSVGTFFIAKTFVVYLACFVAPVNGGVLPFSGRCSMMIDVFLCAFAFVVYHYRDTIIVKYNKDRSVYDIF